MSLETPTNLSPTEAITQRTARIAVLGLGFIGLPTSLALAHAGFCVVGVDVNAARVDALNRGHVHINEPGLAAYHQDALRSGRFHAATAVPQADVFILAVPTPLTSENTVDLRFVQAAVAGVAARLQKGNLVIVESSVPPGTTTNRVAAQLRAQTGLHPGSDYDLVHCPERAIPGKLLDEICHNDRLIGGTTPQAAERAALLYGSFVTGDIPLTDATTAELVKLMENTYRDVNIALANELSLVCERLGIDVTEAIGLANRHPRVDIHQPGIGVGGDCIPVSPRLIANLAPEATPLIQAARAVNEAMPSVTADRIERAMRQRGLAAGASVGVIGLTYKANVGDFRQSPALAVAQALQRRGYAVRVFDAFLPAGLTEYEGLPVGSKEAVQGCEYVVELVKHTV